MKALLALCLSLGACAPFMRHAATATEVLAEGSLACDGGSTSFALHSGRYGETNPMLGQFPGDGTLATYFGSFGAAVFGANRALSRWPIARVLLNAAVIGVEEDAIQNNVEAGVPVCGI